MVSADLGTTTVDVKLYKVADISEVGDYAASGDFAQLDVSALDASDSTSADEWLKRATEAAGMVTDSTKPTAEVSLTDGDGKAGPQDFTWYWRIRHRQRIMSTHLHRI